VSIKHKELISISCTILALLILGVAVVVVVQKPSCAAVTIDAVPIEEYSDPYQIQISPERPRTIGSLDGAATSQDVHLSVNGIDLGRYDIYYADEECILALHFTSNGKRVDLSETLLGLGLRSKSGDLMMSGGGSLWTLLSTPEQPDPIRQGPFTLWVTFGSIDFNALEKVNGKDFATEAAEPYVEIYLSNRSDGGITYVGYDGPADYTSPFVKITDVQIVGRK
jgi:hypothetical protein